MEAVMDEIRIERAADADDGEACDGGSDDSLASDEEEGGDSSGSTPSPHVL
jgi:hypothetical protein